MLNLTLRQLRALAAIADEGKIVRAAKVLGLTAPAVTLQLKQLEDELGLVLFDRTPHGMRPTTAGETALEAARAVFERLDELEEELGAIKGGKKGSVRVGVVSTAQYIGPRLCEAFSDACPDIAVALQLGSRPETLNRLKAREVDVVLTSRPPRDLSVRATAFAEYRSVIVAAPAHPLASRKAITRADLRAEHFVVREPGSGPRVNLETFLTRGNASRSFHYTEMTSNAAIRQAVMSDLGIAFVATHTVADELAQGRLVVLDVKGLPLCRQWFAITRSDQSMTPAMQRFHEFLARHGAAHLQPNDAYYAQD